MKNKAEGYWGLELWADCPKCGKAGCYTEFVCAGDRVSDELVSCNECSHEFEISAEEYSA